MKAFDGDSARNNYEIDSARFYSPRPPRVVRRDPRLFFILFILTALCLAAPAPALASNCRWIGGGADNKWSTSANWNGCVRPANNDTVMFLDGAPKPVSINDLGDLVLDSLLVTGAANSNPLTNPFGDHWDVTGNALTLTGMLQVDAGRDRFGEGPAFRAPIALGANATFRVNPWTPQILPPPFFLPASAAALTALPASIATATAAPASARVAARPTGDSDSVTAAVTFVQNVLTLGGVNLNGQTLQVTTADTTTIAFGSISGAGAIVKSGIGFITLSNPSSYTGPLTITQGVVIATHSQAFGAPGAGNETLLVPTGAAVSLEGNATLDETFLLGGTPGAASTTQQIRSIAGVTNTITGTITMPGPAGIFVDLGGRLTISGPIAGAGQQLTKTGEGVLVVTHAPNAWAKLNINGGKVVAGVGALADFCNVEWKGLDTTLEVTGDARVMRILGFKEQRPTLRIDAGTFTLDVQQGGLLESFFAGKIIGTGSLRKRGPADATTLGPIPSTYTGTTIVDQGRLSLSTNVNALAGPVLVQGRGQLIQQQGQDLVHNRDAIPDTVPVTINAPGVWTMFNLTEQIGSLSGDGLVTDPGGDSAQLIILGEASTTYSGGINLYNWTKRGQGTFTFSGLATQPGRAGLDAGTLEIDGFCANYVDASGGVLAGIGTIGRYGPVSNVYYTNIKIATISPGMSGGAAPGILHLGSLNFGIDPANPIVLKGHAKMQLDGPVAGTGYDQIDLTGDLTIFSATLDLTRTFSPPAGASFTLFQLAPFSVVRGTFEGLPEGAQFTLADQPYRITYRGGDGNDVVITALADGGQPPPPPPPPGLTYNLAEGATSDFFDEDVLIANPNDREAPITLTFSKETGEQVTQTRTLAAQSRLTLHVDEIPELNGSAVSTRVTSTSNVPLIVERSMFWDASYYAGHTGGAVDQPTADWFFAEGSQGYFQTYVLAINPNQTPVDLTFTFFRENDVPVVRTLPLAASTRLTLDAGTIPELVDRSFGIAVHASGPIMAERAMYFGSTPSRLWSGGHESAGVTAPSTHWFLAEGATGGFFDTFVLLSNPNNAEAHVTLQYLLDTGETISVPKTIAPNARLTTNIETEEDVRLHAANMSTVVNADVPIIAERSMYWPGSPQPWREGHNSFGVVDASTTWGLAEGRVGGPHAFHTYILLANPQASAADVTIRYLRETGEPVTQTYAVPATSRVTVDVNGVDGLQDASFGAVISVTNNVPIIVERSMYWDSNGVAFSGGSNATGIRLQP